MRKKKSLSIIFFGELPPKTIHGASISNNINISILSSKYSVTIVEEYSDIRYHERFSFRKVLTFSRAWLVLLKKLILKPYAFYYGVIYLSPAGICKNIAAVFLFKLRNPLSRVVLHFHRSDSSRFLSGKFNSLLFNFLSVFVWKYLLLSSKQMHQFDNRLLGKLEVLPNTIEKEYNVEISSPILYSQICHIVYIGNYIKEKGILDLVEAVKLYNNCSQSKVELKCYGNFTNEEVTSRIQELVKDEEFITINSAISGQEKFDVLSHAHLTALPSYNEGLPLSLLESISLGIPMIITNVGFISDVLGDDYTFYCEPNNPSSIVRCIEKYMQQIDKKSLSEELKKKFCKFSMVAHTQILLDIFAK